MTDSLSFINFETEAKFFVIRLEVRSFFSRGYFLKCGHLGIPAKLHCPKDGRSNKNLLYTLRSVNYLIPFSPCSFLPYVGMVTILMNDYPYLKVSVSLLYCNRYKQVTSIIQVQAAPKSPYSIACVSHTHTHTHTHSISYSEAWQCLCSSTENKSEHFR